MTEIIDNTIKWHMQFRHIIKFTELDAKAMCYPDEVRYMTYKDDNKSTDDIAREFASMFDSQIFKDIIQHKYVRNHVYGVKSFDAVFNLIEEHLNSPVVYYPLKWFSRLRKPSENDNMLSHDVFVNGLQILNNSNTVLICSADTYTFDVALYENDEYIGIRLVKQNVLPVSMVYGIQV